MVEANSFSNLSGVDLQRVLLICEQLHCSDSGKSFVRHCQHVMLNGFSNVHFSAERYQLDPFTLLEQPIQTLEEKSVPRFCEHMPEHPYLKRMLMSSTESGMIQAEPTVKNLRQSSLFNEFYTEVQAQNQLWVGIHCDNELLNCIYSRDSEYTTNELSMMCIIQPHLESAWKNWHQIRKLRQELGIFKDTVFQSPEEEARAACIRRSIDRLSPRRRDVAELVANGLDNQQIADQLKISIQTVKKHLQSIFQLLDVHHRTELTARWHQAHSISIY